MPSPDKLSLHDLYSCQCPDCVAEWHKVESVRLSISDTENDELQKAFNKAARWIYKNKKSSISSGDINENAVQPLFNGINSVLQDGFKKGIEHFVPFIVQRNLSENVYIFSCAKTYAELKSLSENLLDAIGNIKPFSKFWQDVETVYPRYNQSYLEAEYIFATQSAQMASKWSDYESDGDRYNLQYRTAGDDRVRESHWLLHNTTLPPSDPFWNDYFPPNGWRCRCTTVQVRKNKYPESNSAQVQQLGAEATEGKNNIFRFNPGKQQVIFPPHHPYLKALNGMERETLAKKTDDVYSIKTADDVIKAVNEIGKDRNWFARGFSKLEVTRRRVNGSTDMDGRIWLSKERFDNTISGINKLSKGEQIASNEADSLATFWHEINHNRNKRGNMRMSHLQTRYMELSNEFVSRNTLPEFYEAFGSKVQFPDLMVNRQSTGYNSMVNNYQKIISKTGLENGKVVESVRKHLFDEAYNDQKDGLTKALEGAKKSDGSALKKAEINSLVKYCDQMSETAFERFLDDLIR